MIKNNRSLNPEMLYFDSRVFPFIHDTSTNTFQSPLLSLKDIIKIANDESIWEIDDIDIVKTEKKVIPERELYFIDNPTDPLTWVENEKALYKKLNNLRRTIASRRKLKLFHVLSNEKFLLHYSIILLFLVSLHNPITFTGFRIIYFISNRIFCEYQY